jgi:hypothetical protein
MEPVEILDRTIQAYESGQLRWRQYGPDDADRGGLCVQQAIWWASSPNGNNHSIQPYGATLKAVRDHVGALTVPHWNDDPDLTFSVMLDTLKAVANGLRSNT